jgi:hypothetical protein
VLATIAGALLAVVAAYLLAVSAVVYLLGSDPCWDDACVDPPPAFWGGAVVAAPYALVALSLLSGACYVTMHGRRRIGAAVLIAGVSSVVFLAGLWLVAETGTADDGDLLLALVGSPSATAWIMGTIAAARRAGRLHHNPHA